VAATTSDARLHDRLAEDRNVWMCTRRSDGPPHLSPIWFVWHAGRLWSCTTSTAVKVRNLQADARLTLALEDGNDPVVVEGSATLHTRPYPAPVVDAFQAKYGWDIRVPDDEGDWATLIEVAPTRWLFAGPPDGPGPEHR